MAAGGLTPGSQEDREAHLQPHVLVLELGVPGVEGAVLGRLEGGQDGADGGDEAQEGLHGHVDAEVAVVPGPAPGEHEAGELPEEDEGGLGGVSVAAVA